MTAVLEITDGTTTISLIKGKGKTGFHLESWRPNIPFYKGGGTWQQSSLAWGRQLVDKQFENYIDSFSLKVNELSQNAIILEMQDMRRLLEKASSYWATDWQDTPVYLKAKADNEDNYRYALIYTGLIAEDENPYNQPFLQPICGSVMDRLTLVIEHAMWTENEPGTVTATEIGQSATYNGVTRGNVDSSGVLVPTTSEEVYRTNCRNEANITHIFIDDGGVFGANRVGAALPYALFPAAPAVNDATYFGIDSTLADSGPFFNLVFDIGTTRSGFSITWEYWNGGAWAAFPLGDRDNTNGFANAGVNGYLWTGSDPATWTTLAVNGVTAYWLRARVTAAPGPFTVPTQQNRNPYAINWPYIEVQSTDIAGDIASLIKTRLIERNELTTTENMETRFWLLGSRCVSRGSNFTAFINIADEQNPTGITVAAAGGSAFASTVLSPTGRHLSYTAAGVTSFTTRGTITISTPLTQEYYGKYHAYLRVSGIISSNTVSVRLRVTTSSGGQTITSSSVVGGITALLPTPLIALDFETLTLEGTSLLSSSDSIDTITIDIQVATTVGATINFVDLVLIPVDEFATQISVSSSVNGLEQGEQLVIDSIEYPKSYIRAYKQIISSSLISGIWPTITASKHALQANAQQRVWMLTAGDDSGTMISYYENVQRILLDRQQRYLSMRGER